MIDAERFTGGHAIGVDVAAIERDLAGLWRKASSGDRAVTRACAWNLVVHAVSEPELARAQQLADALVAAVPARTLILHHRPNATGPEVEAFVTANCRLLPGGGKLLCSEEITVEARGRGGDHLPSLTRALLVPDIPTAVLWAALPPHQPLVEELLEAADRVLLDTGRAGPEGLARVEHLGSRATARVADLSWLRGAQLRLVLAGAFDAPVDATMLFRLKRVAVECAPAALSSAKLLLGWLGARLSWGTPEALGDRATPGWLVPRQQGQVRLDVSFTDAADGVQRVTLESDKGERVRVTATAQAFTIDGACPSHTVPVTTHGDDSLVIAALGPRGADRLYQSALHRAVELEDR